MTQACTFLDQLPASTTDKERVAHGNAERLLGLSPAEHATRRWR